MFVRFVIPGGAAQAGWTSYSPLATTIPTHGQLFWIVGMFFLISSSLLGAVNFIAPIPHLRPRGMRWMPLPWFVWAQFVTALILLLAFPPLEAAAVMQLMDNVAHTTFFLPTGLAVGGQLANVSGGGSPLLWQHLFWFLGHPEVYVLILPAMGIVCEVIANNTRKPIWGYKSLVFAVLSVGFLSFIVWAHHMYLTGMGTKISTFFQATTMIISIPSVIILTCLFISLWGGSIRFNTPMLFALAFLPMFGIGGLTGFPLGFNISDVHLHDTYYIIAHFPYVVAPGTIFALFAGIYYWYPKMTGRMMNEFWGRVHFWGSFVFMNVVFMPMFAQGMAGMLRRMSDGGANYSAAVNSRAGAEVIGGFSDGIIHLPTGVLWGAIWLGLPQISFFINVFWGLKHGHKAESGNPRAGTPLESPTPTLLAWVACNVGQFTKFKFFHACTIALALMFLCVKLYEYHDKWIHYEIKLTDGRFADGHFESAVYVDKAANKELEEHGFRGSSFAEVAAGVTNQYELVSVTLAGRIVTDEKDLMDLRAQKHVEHGAVTIERAQIKSMENY